MITDLYAVRCSIHGHQVLTETQYDEQLENADNFWQCPICGDWAEWDGEDWDETLQDAIDAF